MNADLAVVDDGPDTASMTADVEVDATLAVTDVGPDVAAIAAVAKRNKLPLHLDGARLANALASTGATAAEMIQKTGVDVVSFGGTKNGLMGVEAVIMFNPENSWEFELRRKRSGHLMSKHRYLSAQMQAYLTDDLWLKSATIANERAAELGQGLSDIDSVELCHPVQANMVFAKFSRARHRAAIQAGATYYFAPFDTSIEGDDNEILTARMVCSWSTTSTEIDQLLALISA